MRYQCDRKSPGCTQCLRMSTPCPGYRDPLDVLFRDESDNVMKKAEAGYKASLMKRSRNGHAADTAVSSFAVRCNPSQPVEHVAFSLFMSSYVPGSHFAYLPSLYAQTGLSSPFFVTLHSVSIALLSHELGEPSLISGARRLYSTALSETNLALASPTTAVQDSTLVSVLLLSLFEAIVWPGLRTPNNWTTHTDGALTLLRLRGTQQFHTDLGRRLFLQVVNIVYVNCIRRNTCLPPHLVELVSAAAKAFEKDDPQLAFTFLTADAIEFLAAVKEGRHGALEMVRAATTLDQRYVVFTKELPRAWQYTELSRQNHDQTSEVLGNTIHLYPWHRVAQLWNSCRMTRVLLNEIIYAQAAFLDGTASSLEDSQSSLQHQAAKNIQDAALDICASVPQFTSSAPTKATVASLLWPLSAVRGASLAPEPARQYAVEQLRYLGRESKFQQAERVAGCGYDIDALQDG